MKLMERMEAAAGGGAEQESVVSLCSLMAGGRLFGIDTHRIREVLGARQLERVPLAPPYIGGVIPYRGEVLTAVSLRALLGIEASGQRSCVLVLDEGGERFGLMVDSVGGVVMPEKRSLAENPTTLDEVSRALYGGAYRMQDGLLIQLDPERLHPSRLEESGLFGHGGRGAGRGTALAVNAGQGMAGAHFGRKEGR